MNLKKPPIPYHFPGLKSIVRLPMSFGMLVILMQGMGQVNLPIDESTGLITFREVIQEEGTSQELFNRAVGWINITFTNPTDVTRVRDPETGEIKGLHRFKIFNADKEGNTTDAGIIQYEFVLEFKEGRYRYTLNNFVLKQSSRIHIEKWLNREDPQYIPAWDSYLEQVHQFVKDWIKSLEKGLKPPVTVDDDDW
ncbi:MAG: DUF4468 domain-containing protein [Bacteroidales bacterium]|nr:DUF4468 domain-containing protein [Bacteroidales bacterium]